MLKNMGTTDRIIRAVLALIAAFFILDGTVTGWLALVLGIFAVVFVLTSFISVCPLYKPFNISTLKKRATP
jgi:Ca2+/Na+ antiporter